jgi:class 3 adenylate cyclase
MQDAERWGTAGYARSIAVWRAAERAGIEQGARHDLVPDPALVDAYARINRNTASPDIGKELTRMWWQTDARGILGAVQARAVLVTGEADDVEETQHVASLMPAASVKVVPGRSGLAIEPTLDAIRELAGVRRRAPALDTVLVSVLFTDIVDSTATQAALGDRGWKELIVAHHAVVRDELARWHGVEHDTAGDGFFATFEGPARAIHCAREIARRVRALGIEIRAGVHIGECEIADGKVAGIAVSTGARIAARAGRSQVLVSQTVKDLVAGSDLAFTDEGEHELKGVPGRWRLHAAVGV